MVSQEVFLAFLVPYAYQPWFVYSAVIGLLFLSSFGLPFPEEITLVSAGLLSYLAQNPVQFPPPYEGASPVHPIILSIVCFFAVFLSDFLVYMIGKKGGNWIRSSRRLKKYTTSVSMHNAEAWTKKYGAWMAGVFRFTPGLRFPGHMACGMFGVTPMKFTLVDGTAALLTVPTQVLLVGYYGEYVLKYFTEFKYFLLSLLLMALVFYIFKKTKIFKRV